MKTEIITALIAFAGSAFGTLGGILASNRLTNYRIEQLEKKVDKHNNLIDRTYHLEERTALLEYKIDDLEKEAS